MSEEFAPSGKRTLIRDPSPALAALDTDIRTRFAKRTGELEAFLHQWIRLDESQKAFFEARGKADENYLQFVLSRGDIAMSLAIARMASLYAESTDSERVLGFLNHIDRDGNDIWHYLADNLTSQEDEDSLEIAKLLIQLEIDFSRKNDDGESPLGRLLVPEPKWQSINSLLHAKTLSVEEMEEAFPTRIQENQTVKAELMTSIFVTDLMMNDARLTQHVLYNAMHPKTERDGRASVARVMFEYVGGKRSESVLMRVMETDKKEVLEKLLELLQRCAEEYYAPMAAGDLQLAKASHQLYIYRRIARRNRIFQNVLSKAITADRAPYISEVLRLLRNEELVVLKRTPQGGQEREVLTVDKNSPAPHNPCMSLLLQQDARGNLPFHSAVLAGRLDCLRKLFFGLSLVDAYTILARIPNRYNLTVSDLLAVRDTHGKLSAEIKAQRISLEDAQAILQAVKQVDPRIVEFLQEALKKATDVIQRTGGASAAKPTFDLARIPTVQLALQNRRAAAAGGPAPIAAAAQPRPAAAG